MHRETPTTRKRISEIFFNRISQRDYADIVSPGRCTEVTFAVSMNALMFLRAGMKHRGFCEAESRTR